MSVDIYTIGDNLKNIRLYKTMIKRSENSKMSSRNMHAVMLM